MTFWDEIQLMLKTIFASKPAQKPAQKTQTSSQMPVMGGSTGYNPNIVDPTTHTAGASGTYSPSQAANEAMKAGTLPIDPGTGTPYVSGTYGIVRNGFAYPYADTPVVYDPNIGALDKADLAANRANYLHVILPNSGGEQFQGGYYSVATGKVHTAYPTPYKTVGEIPLGNVPVQANVIPGFNAPMTGLNIPDVSTNMSGKNAVRNPDGTYSTPK